MHHETIDVTPELAKQWLASNTDNRKLSQPYVSRLARDMTRGEFAYVADPIRFDTAGKLIDGQHRLTAIVQSGTTQKLLVVTGMDRSDRRFLDRGRKRSVADNLRMDFGVSNASTVAAIARMVIRWERGSMRNTNLYRPNDTETYDLVVQHTDAFIDAAVYAMRLRSSIGAQLTATGTAYYLTYRHNPMAAHIFWQRIEYGTELRRGDPALAARNAIVRASAGSMYGTAEQHLAMLLRAWRSASKGRTLSRLAIQRLDKITDDDYDLE